jgi:hypothetical protein
MAFAGPPKSSPDVNDHSAYEVGANICGRSESVGVAQGFLQIQSSRLMGDDGHEVDRRRYGCYTQMESNEHEGTRDSRHERTNLH